MLTISKRASGGRPQTAAERGYEPRLGKFAEGDTVRVRGLVGEKFKVLGFRAGNAELFGLGQNTGHRTIPVDRIVKAQPWPVKS
jgi:hypothetical protein